MFLGGFLLAAPFWMVNLVPPGAYPSVSIQLGTIAAYFIVLVIPLPLWRILRHFPGCQAAIITVLSWEILVIRWLCVEDDRSSRLSMFLLVPFVRNLAFLLATLLVIYAGILAWSSSRASGSWPPRLWVVAVLGELFALQEFYRNGGEFPTSSAFPRHSIGPKCETLILCVWCMLYIFLYLRIPGLCVDIITAINQRDSKANDAHTP